MKTINQSTQLAGENRVELLLFRLDGNELFGINVFKVTEVTRSPTLTRTPGSHEMVRGIAQLRGKVVPVLDLAGAVGRPRAEVADSYAIITEYNRHTQGFLVAGVERIANVRWEDMVPPPSGAALSGYLTAVTEVDGQLVQILDVERILAEVFARDDRIADLRDATSLAAETRPVLVVDDSVVARTQVQRTLEQMGLQYRLATNGREALDLLRQCADQGPLDRQFCMVISDIEMPQMDGYTLVTEIRRDPALAGLHVMLHTSLSGVFNRALVEKVGADQFIAKFDPDELAGAVREALGTGTRPEP